MGNGDDSGCHDEDVIRIITLNLLLLEILVKRRMARKRWKNDTSVKKRVFFLFGGFEISYEIWWKSSSATNKFSLVWYSVTRECVSLVDFEQFLWDKDVDSSRRLCLPSPLWPLPAPPTTPLPSPRSSTDSHTEPWPPLGETKRKKQKKTWWTLSEEALDAFYHK